MVRLYTCVLHATQKRYINLSDEDQHPADECLRFSDEC